MPTYTYIDVYLGSKPILTWALCGCTYVIELSLDIEVYELYKMDAHMLYSIMTKMGLGIASLHVDGLTTNMCNNMKDEEILAWGLKFVN